MTFLRFSKRLDLDSVLRRRETVFATPQEFATCIAIHLMTYRIRDWITWIVSVVWALWLCTEIKLLVPFGNRDLLDSLSIHKLFGYSNQTLLMTKDSERANHSLREERESERDVNLKPWKKEERRFTCSLGTAGLLLVHWPFHVGLII